MLVSHRWFQLLALPLSFHCYARHYLFDWKITCILKYTTSFMPISTVCRMLNACVHTVYACIYGCVCAVMSSKERMSTPNYLQYVSWIRSHLHHLIININSLNMWPNFRHMNEWTFATTRARSKVRDRESLFNEAIFICAVKTDALTLLEHQQNEWDGHRFTAIDIISLGEM